MYIAMGKTCKRGKQKNGNNRCVKKCGRGKKRDSTTNKCVKYAMTRSEMLADSPTSSSLTLGDFDLDAELDAEICPEGYEKNKYGKCVRICNPEWFRDTDGKCKKIHKSVINLFETDVSGAPSMQFLQTGNRVKSRRKTSKIRRISTP